MIKGEKSEGGSRHGNPLNETPDDALTFVVFSTAGETFAINVAEVKEIIRVPAITWVPGSRDPVRGVINLRGSVVPVIDLAGALLLASGEKGPEARVLIVERKGDVIGFLVERVMEVAEISASAIEPSLRTLGDNEKKMVCSQTTHRKALIGILDMESVSDAAQALQGAS